MEIRKRALINNIYKVIDLDIKGFFRDDNWSHVYEVLNKIGGVAESVEGEMDRGLSQYNPEPLPKRWKKWPFTIFFTNQNGRDDKIFGTLTASGAGSTVDPLERYDITVVLS